MEADRKLAERAAAGDELAFAELVERHREPPLRLGGGPVPADLRAWLCTIAWRRALDLARRERDSLPLDTGVASTDDPQARVIEAQELGRVVAAFTELPARQRKALALSALEGRSLEEIGDALDVAPGHAKSLG